MDYCGNNSTLPCYCPMLKPGNGVHNRLDGSIIMKDKLIDRSKDTIYVKDVSVEYRYKLLRDTVKVVQRDSIPYEVTIVETKEITRPLTWFDHLTRFSFWFLIGVIAAFLFIKFKHVLKKY